MKVDRKPVQKEEVIKDLKIRGSVMAGLYVFETLQAVCRCTQLRCSCSNNRSFVDAHSRERTSQEIGIGNKERNS